MDINRCINVAAGQVEASQSADIGALRQRVQRLIVLGREQWEGSRLKEATNVYYDCVRICCAAIMFSTCDDDRRFFYGQLEIAAKQLPHVSEYWHKANGVMQLAEDFFGAGKLRNALRLAEEASSIDDAYSGRRRHFQGVNDLHFKSRFSLEREGVRLISSPHLAALESVETDEDSPVEVGPEVESASDAEAESVARATPGRSLGANRVLLAVGMSLIIMAVLGLILALRFNWV